MDTLKQKLQQTFICAKCRARGGSVEELTIPSGPLSRIISVSGTRFYAVSCTLCGYTELYNPAVVVPVEEEVTTGATELVKGAENA